MPADLLLPQLERIHEAKLAICDRLEAIADALPIDVSRCECEAVAAAIGPLLESSQLFEEEVLFPYCEKLSARYSSTFDRLRAEHSEDVGYGEELAETLLAVGDDRPVAGAETLGFMLRGFFGSLRRHVAFEEEYIRMIVTQNRESQNRENQNREGQKREAQG